MVGNYPDIPAPRMAYDRDGTQGYIGPANFTSVSSQMTTAQLRGLNGEVGYSGVSSPSGDSWAIGWVFPELRDLQGAFWLGNGSGDGSFQVSTNTTNLVDGTWTAYTAAMGTNYRNDIRAVSASGIKAIRLNLWQGSSRMFHFYGKPSAGQNPDRLEFWHPTLDQALSVTPAHFDWGDRPRSTSMTKQVRVKNLSSTWTANSVSVGIEALTDATPTVVDQHTFSLDGVTFSAAPLALPAALAPGGISPVITVRQSLASNDVLSLWAQRIFAVAGSWS